MKKIIIIDGCAIIYRAYYATLTNKKNDFIMKTSFGFPTNALVGFINTINRLIATISKDDLIFVGFDSGESFRKKEFSEYKTNRKPMPEDLKQQIPAIYEFLDIANIKYFKEKGFEGDDICGSIAILASKDNYDVFIYTSDKDFLQLIDEKITINMIQKGLSNIKTVTNKNIEELYGFKPSQLTDFKGLAGDHSDNLPGIPKIGDKKAIDLLKKYNNLENVIDHASDFKGQIKENILNFSKQGLMTKKLAKIKTDLSFPFAIKDLTFQNFNIEKMNLFCKKYELKNTFQKLSITNEFKKNENNNYINVLDLPSDNYKEIYFWLLTNNNDDNYNDKTTFAKSIFVKTSECIFMIYSQNFDNAKKLKKVLADEKIKKYTYNFKKTKVILNKINIQINGLCFDLLLASYLLNYPIQENINEINNIDTNEKIRAINYLKLLSNLKNDFLKKLEENEMINLFYNIEIPINNLLADMEIEGVPVNKKKLEEIQKKFEEKNKIIASEIFSLAGKEFNILSPKQVISALEKVIDFKKTSSSSNVLNDLKDKNKIIDKILKYRSYAKLITSIKNIIENIQNEKLHTIFHQVKTSTGRLSSSKPNLQNIATNDEDEREIKKAFYYQNNEYYFLSFDYSQIELKILSILANEQHLIDIFKKDKDIHSEMAKKIFNLSCEPKKEERQIAKEINYSIIYGMKSFSLSKKINNNIHEAKKIIDNFFEKNKNIKSFFENIILNMNKYKYVKTFFNRKRFFENELKSKNFHIREFAKRAAINMPVQGTVADIIKISMLKINDFLKKNNYKSKLILQIHDELIFKTLPDEKNELIKNITNIMENFDCFPIKLKVNVNYGKDLYEICK